jgi:hypothetical protein
MSVDVSVKIVEAVALTPLDEPASYSCVIELGCPHEVVAVPPSDPGHWPAWNFEHVFCDLPSANSSLTIFMVRDGENLGSVELDLAAAIVGQVCWQWFDLTYPGFFSLQVVLAVLPGGSEPFKPTAIKPPSYSLPEEMIPTLSEYRPPARAPPHAERELPRPLADSASSDGLALSEFLSFASESEPSDYVAPVEILLSSSSSG